MSERDKWDGMTLEEAFLELLETNPDEAIRMMNLFPEKMRAKYREIYIKWRNRKE